MRTSSRNSEKQCYHVQYKQASYNMFNAAIDGESPPLGQESLILSQHPQLELL